MNLVLQLHITWVSYNQIKYWVSLLHWFHFFFWYKPRNTHKRRDWSSLLSSSTCLETVKKLDRFCFLTLSIHSPLSWWQPFSDLSLHPFQFIGLRQRHLIQTDSIWFRPKPIIILHLPWTTKTGRGMIMWELVWKRCSLSPRTSIVRACSIWAAVSILWPWQETPQGRGTSTEETAPRDQRREESWWSGFSP